MNKMDKKPYITIVNFRNFLHYSDRPVIWLKLYYSILDSVRFYQLTAFEKWIFIGLLLLAGKKENKIFYETNYLNAKLVNFKTEKNKEETLESAIDSLKREGLIAIKMLSLRYQNACLDKSRVEKSRVDKNIATVFTTFKKINPTINYGNTTQRKAIVDLIKQFGFEKTNGFAEFAVLIHGKKYAPVITTPWQLREKLSALESYYKREKPTKNKILW